MIALLAWGWVGVMLLLISRDALAEPQRALPPAEPVSEDVDYRARKIVLRQWNRTPGPTMAPLDSLRTRTKSWQWQNTSRH